MSVPEAGTRRGVASRSLALHGTNNWCLLAPACAEHADERGAQASGLLLDSAWTLDGALGGYPASSVEPKVCEAEQALATPRWAAEGIGRRWEWRRRKSIGATLIKG